MVMTAFVGFPQDVHEFTADEVGKALSGLVARESSGLPRVGMLGTGPKVAAVPAAWKVSVAPFVYVDQVSGAIQLSGMSAEEELDIVPASGDVPSGQARIDAIGWDPVDAELVVVKGTPATSPAIPSLGGLASVGRVRVNAGDGMVIAARVTQNFQFADRVLGTISSFASGYSVTGNTRLERDAQNMVDAYVEITKGSGSIGSNELMVTFPTGFRPAANVEFSGVVSQGGNAAPVFVRIAASGGVSVFNPAGGNTRCSFHVRFRAVV